MKKVVLFAVPVLAAFAVYWNMSVEDLSTEKVAIKSHSDSKAEVNKMSQPEKVVVDSYAKKPQADALVEEQALDGELWQASDEAKGVLEASNTLPADLKGEVYLELDLNELAALEIGSTINLAIPQVGESYPGEVDYITEHKNGDRTVEANIPGFDRAYMAVITIGEKGVYGQMNLPTGAYVIQSVGSHAWLASKTDLSKGHQEDSGEHLHAEKLEPVSLLEGDEDPFGK